MSEDLVPLAQAGEEDLRAVPRHADDGLRVEPSDVLVAVLSPCPAEDLPLGRVDDGQDASRGLDVLDLEPPRVGEEGPSPPGEIDGLDLALPVARGRDPELGPARAPRHPGEACDVADLPQGPVAARDDECPVLDRVSPLLEPGHPVAPDPHRAEHVPRRRHDAPRGPLEPELAPAPPLATAASPRSPHDADRTGKAHGRAAPPTRGRLTRRPAVAPRARKVSIRPNTSPERETDSRRPSNPGTRRGAGWSHRVTKSCDVEPPHCAL